MKELHVEETQNMIRILRNFEDNSFMAAQGNIAPYKCVTADLKNLVWSYLKTSVH